MTLSRKALAAIVVGIFAAGYAIGALADHHEAKDTFHKDIFKVEVQASPDDPDGPKFAPVWGNPQEGASAVVGEFRPGQTSPLHSHAADYHAVLISGSWKHWDKDGTKEKAKAFGPNTYWYQKGGAAHGDACVSDKPCRVFFYMDGKLTFTPVEMAKSDDGKMKKKKKKKKKK